MSVPSTSRALRLRMLVALGLIVCLPFAFVYTFVFLANTVGIALLEWANERPYHGEFYVDPVLLTVIVLAASSSSTVSTRGRSSAPSAPATSTRPSTPTSTRR